MKIFSIREDALALKYPRMAAVAEDLPAEAANQEVKVAAEVVDHQAPDQMAALTADLQVQVVPLMGVAEEDLLKEEINHPEETEVEKGI